MALRFPKTIERDFERRVKALVRALERLFQQAAADWAKTNLRQDAPGDVARLIARVRTAFFRGFSESDVYNMVEKIYNRTEKFVDQQLVREFIQGAGVRPLLADIPKTRAASFARRNADLIVTLLEDQIRRIEKGALEVVATGARHESLAAVIQKESGTARWHAKFLARDQTAKLVSNINQHRQEALGVTRYTWRTVQDERVRASHEELDGQVFSWNDPPDVGHPGEDYQCLPPFVNIDIAMGAKVFTRRRFKGVVVRLSTALGDVIYATPNHPILTPFLDWVPIGDIEVGDHVMCADIAREPVEIYKLFDAAEQLYGIDRAPGAPGQFHGDGSATYTTESVQVGEPVGRCGPEGIDFIVDKVVEVERIAYDGDVYNMETESGWYVADGVIVANCRCIAEPVLSDVHPAFAEETA